MSSRQILNNEVVKEGSMHLQRLGVVLLVADGAAWINYHRVGPVDVIGGAVEVQLQRC